MRTDIALCQFIRSARFINYNQWLPRYFQIIEWYEEYAEEFFQTHTELGESLEIALALEQEVKQFEDSTKVS